MLGVCQTTNCCQFCVLPPGQLLHAIVSQANKEVFDINIYEKSVNKGHFYFLMWNGINSIQTKLIIYIFTTTTFKLEFRKVVLLFSEMDLVFFQLLESCKLLSKRNDSLNNAFFFRYLLFIICCSCKWLFYNVRLLAVFETSAVFEVGA